jgi:hypothetical protein
MKEITAVVDISHKDYDTLDSWARVSKVSLQTMLNAVFAVGFAQVEAAGGRIERARTLANDHEGN